MGSHSPLFEGASVRRVDVGAGVAAIEVRLPGETVVVIVAITADARGVGIVTPDARREAWGARLPAGVASPRATRALLEGGHVVALGPRGVTILACENQRHVLGIDGPRVQLLADGRDDPDGRGPYRTEERKTLEALGEVLLRAVLAGAIVRRREALTRAVGRGIAKLERRIQALGVDLARIGDADEMAHRATWLVAAAVRAPRGVRSLSVTDWSTGVARVIEVPLDPAKSAKEQVDAMFHRARRLKRGAVVAATRLEQAERARARLREKLADIQAASTLLELEEHFAVARAFAPRDVAACDSAADARAQGTSARGKTQKSVPYREFLTASGVRVLVGKGATQNDALTFQIARPHDLWLHVKGLTGAHVVVPLAKNRACPPDVLIDAAHLAAHFSDARGEAMADVTYVARKYLRKPRGGAPGMVVVEREKVLVVRIEPLRMKALLEAEEVPA